MTNEEHIQQDLIQQFPFLDGKVRIQRPRRVWADVPNEHFREVFEFAVKKLEFVILSTMTGLDEGEQMGFLYHLARENGIILNIKIQAAKSSPVIKTVTDLFPAAELYEREVEDLLGAKVEGLAPGRHYPLPDDWPVGEFPLRKDWKFVTPEQKAQLEQKEEGK
jgi:Ni,Fe-hydrogenase III component G